MNKTNLKRDFAVMYKWAMREEDPEIAAYWQGRLDTLTNLTHLDGHKQLALRMHRLIEKLKDHRLMKGREQNG